MFPLHETTQRWLCRSAFALFCLLPTTSLVAYALWLKTPLHEQAQSDLLSHATGTVVTFDDIVYPQPGITRLHNVALTHPTNGQTLATIRELEIVHEANRLIVYAAQPQLPAEEMDELWRQCQRQLLDESFPQAKPLQLIASDVTVSDNSGEAQTLSTLDVEIQAHDHKRTLTAAFKFADATDASPASLRVVRRNGQLLEVQWDTRSAALPIAPWATQLPWLKRLGKDCRFRGTLVARSGPEGLSGQLQGELSHVNLNALISNGFPHKLSGEAIINIQSARFEDDRLVELRGNIAAGPGVIGNSLVNSATKHWQLSAPAGDVDRHSTKNLFRYDQLALELELANGRLTLLGTCADSPPGTLLVSSEGETWQTDIATDHDVASLIRVLAREENANIPATAATRGLIRWLPLLDESPAQETSKPPQGHLRGGL